MSTPLANPAGPWRAQDLVDLDLTEHQRYEIVDGHLVVTPRPAAAHQVACVELGSQLQASCPAEWLVAVDLDLPMGTDLRVPDLAVIRRDRMRLRRPLAFGPADFGLVVEVVSPSSRKTDLFAKPGEYAEAGIPLFWRLDLSPSVQLHAFELRDGVYAEAGALDAAARVPVPWGELEIDLLNLATLLGD